ncbi:MAG: hypothetical protein ACRDHU_14900 [Actinomycetota bacterium]
MTAGDWMRELAAHLERMGVAYPEEHLCIVFDIDGTIVDTRHLGVHVLLAFDRHHGTSHFLGLTADDVVAHETQIEALLRPFALPARLRGEVATWYADHARDPDAIAAAHRPYQGVLSVIRWFQLQPRTHVALNTGRPESMRELTLASLNALGRLHRVTFASDLLFMNDGDWPTSEEAKVDGLRRLDDAGYRIVAVVDNEPSNLLAMMEADGAGEILFLHAETLFESQRLPLPAAVSGTEYGLSGLVREADLGRRVTFVWHGVNDASNLRQFMTSDVRWAEIDVRRDPLGRLVLRHDSFGQTPWGRDEQAMMLADALETFRWVGRKVKLDLKESDGVVEEALDLTRRYGFGDDELWFNGAIETVGGDGLAAIRSARPGAVRSCPIDFVVPLLLAAPEEASRVLGLLRAWGVTRVSLDWATSGVRDVLDPVEADGWEVNLYGVPDLESFLEAALLLPASVTADFNFPEWSYFGRGAGKGGAFHDYRLADAAAAGAR